MLDFSLENDDIAEYTYILLKYFSYDENFSVDLDEK
jgi:hypothetical protein